MPTWGDRLGVMSVKSTKRTAKKATIAAGVGGIVLAVWARLGDVSTAQGLFESRIAIVTAFGQFLAWPWSGACVCLCCLAIFGLCALLERRAPTAAEWAEYEDSFGRIEGELDAIWCRYEESGLVRWYVHTRSNEGSKRDVLRFEAEARKAGVALRRAAHVATMFPTTPQDDPTNYWLNALAAVVGTSSMHGAGRDENGKYESSVINKVVNGSRLLCVCLGAESRR